MKEITTIINLEVTFIRDCLDTHPYATDEEYAAYIRKALQADKVDIKQIKHFEMDKKKGKK